MGLATGPDAILNPQVGALVAKPDVVVEPRATAMMADAFRQGFISTEDIMDRLSERATLKRKADVQGLREATSPEAQEARRLALKVGTDRAKAASDNAALEAAANKAKMEQELAKGLLGPNAPLVEAAYTSVGRLIPLKESPDLPGTKVPDLDTISSDLKNINRYRTAIEANKAAAAQWKEETVEVNIGGEKASKIQYRNPVTQETRDTKPIAPVAPTYDDFLKSLAPAESMVVPKASISAPVAAPAPAPAPAAPALTGDQLNQLRAQAANVVGDASAVVNLSPQDLTRLTASSPAPAAPAPVVEAKKQPSAAQALAALPPGVTKYEVPEVKDIRMAVDSVASRYAQNKVVQDAAAAGTAFSAAQEVMKNVLPDGSYNPQMTVLPKQADFNLMVNYAKILDPTSVVREGEIALLKQTSSAFDRLVNGMTGQQVADYVNTVAGRQMFTNLERKSFVNLLSSAYANRLEAVKPLREASAAALSALGATPAQINEALPFHPLGAATTTPEAVPAGGGNILIHPTTGARLQKVGEGQYRVIK